MFRRCCGQARRFEKTKSVGPMHLSTRKATSFISSQLLNHGIESSVPFMPVWSSSSKMVGSPGDLPKQKG